jgi:hypothetical protein
MQPVVQNLYAQYTEFQRKCESAAWQLSKYDAFTRSTRSRPPSPLLHDINRELVSSHRTIVFSDSIFLAATELQPVLDAAGGLVVELLGADVPARGAVAKGHFHTFEWNLRAGQRESFRASAPFLGSGVIRAYRAESKGPRGIRLIIHESCGNDVALLDSWAPVDLAPEEVSEEWQSELNLGLCVLTGIGGVEYLNRHLELLRAKAPDSVRTRHYDPTAQAFSRMDKILKEKIEKNDERQYTRLFNWRDED